MKISIIFAFFLLLSAASDGIAAEKSPEGDVAIKGYDPVAYFLVGKAVKGHQSLTTAWHNLTWHFQNKKHLELFKTNPEKYAPQYDGFCAWAMTEKRKAVTDPEVWKIVNEKLYLNCSQAAYEKWSKDIPGNIKKADANWIQFTSGK
ncbi:YHS domain protein [Desulfopila sp. IMCC35006]|uniref:YHS domain-containing (seleno)protein n=1 Tax=Desulfopila sp. IMCC35006 TaxID=2569542 RepID=UPI0010AD75E9|nr:YHS domain-containing (seleno)protein [Desulfopila sp. IMCC35006]TKB26572.1 YHS domain protein [Desulfopila sp. IMCC35006]